MESASSATEPGALLEFMFRLGQAYLASGEQTALVELFLRRVAYAYGMTKARVVAFPTAIFIAVHDGTKEHITLAEGPTQTLRLDQIGDVYDLGAEAQRGTVPPGEGLDRLVAILGKSARFGRIGLILGHTILSLGLAIVLEPALTNMAAAAVLGAIVGILKVLNRGRPVLAVPLPVVAAMLVSMLVFLALKWGWPVDPLNSLVPPLVSFLPGAILTLGMEELAYGDMVSGSSRLITGFVQLVLLAFGLAAGAALVGYRPASLVDAGVEVAPVPWKLWAPWAGVVVFGVGVYMHFSAPRDSLWWMLLVLLVAFGAQQLAASFFGTDVTGFFGMLVATPLGYLIQLRFKGPPSMVTVLPSFWLLVPGALGLTSVKQMLSDRTAGLEGMTNVVLVFTSIALGSLMGAALYKWLNDRLGWSRVQIERVGTYFRRGGKQ